MEIFKIGDWAQIKNNRPFQIMDKKMVKLCNKMGFKKSSKEQAEQFDNNIKKKVRSYEAFTTN